MRRILLAVAAAIVGMLIAPVVGPIFVRLGRPVVKQGVKAGMGAYRSARVQLALLQETLDDIVAESRDELRHHPEQNVTEP